MTDTEAMDGIARRLREGKSFLVSSHVRIDGDGIASTLAIHLLLRSLGKKSLMMLSGRVPHVFRFLPRAGEIVSLENSTDVEVPDDLDTFFIVDTADVVRLGEVQNLVPAEVLRVSIDHHRTGDIEADLEYCDPEASSTGELIYLLFQHGRFEIGAEIATALYTAVMTDTQGFSLPNTTPLALRIAAEMIEKGAEAGTIGDRVYRSRRPGQLALWAEVASRLQLDDDGKLAWTSLNDEMLAKHDVHPEDTQDLTDVARLLAGVEVGVLFRERASAGIVRVSLRSNHIPILSVAEKFGGGGHALACGCELNGTLEEAESKVLGEIRAVLAAAGGRSP